MSGWDALLGAYRDYQLERAREESAKPAACPQCGEPLTQRPEGIGLFCRFDGWRPEYGSDLGPAYEWPG